MALNVQMVLSENKLINEKMVIPRLVNQQTLDYDTFCDYLAQGSTVTAADVSAVMKQLEKTIPLILALNAKITASPEGLAFRPTLRGSLTQGDLATSVLTASIVIALPKKWDTRFQQSVEFKRVTRATSMVAEPTTPEPTTPEGGSTDEDNGPDII